MNVKRLAFFLLTISYGCSSTYIPDRKAVYEHKAELTDSVLIAHIKAYKKQNIEDVHKNIIYLRIFNYYPDSLKFYLEASISAPYDGQYHAVNYTVIDCMILAIINNSVTYYYNNDMCDKAINRFIANNGIKLSTDKDILYCPPAWLITCIGNKEKIEYIRDTR